MWAQGEIRLDPRRRGFHLITREVLAAVPRVAEVEVGLLHLFIRHTSASLALNENASPDVRADFESFFNETVPEDAPYWTHTLEGADDMPAHVKSSLLGPSLTIPVAGGRLALGTWQGIYLCEHRDHGGPLFHLLAGNLSFQVEHHLYPDMPSSRYAEIAPRVRDICRRYGLPYNTGPLHKQLGTVHRTILRLAFPGGKVRPKPGAYKPS